MDYVAAAEIVSKYRAQVEKLRFTRQADKPAVEEVAQRLYPQVRLIAERAGMAEASRLLQAMHQSSAWLGAIDAADQIVGFLENAHRLAEIVGPGGPQLSASGFHAAVWGPAAALWDGGHLREAVQASATSVELLLRAKLDRPELSGKDLANEAFRTDPPRLEAPRLRFPDYVEGTPDWTSAHEGAQALGRACFQAIRNLVTHRLDQPDKQEALEYLAVLSVFARLVDKADVVRGP